jgi:hypothetical protein
MAPVGKGLHLHLLEEIVVKPVMSQFVGQAETVSGRDVHHDMLVNGDRAEIAGEKGVDVQFFLQAQDGNDVHAEVKFGDLFDRCRK